MVVTREQRLEWLAKARAVRAQKKANGTAAAVSAEPSSPTTSVGVTQSSQPVLSTAEAPILDIQIDWHHIPINDAQALFSELKSELDKAAHAINQRLSERPSFPCSGPGCPNVIKDGEEKFKDSAYNPPRRCCSEKCYMGYMQVEMAKKHADRMRPRA